MRSATWGGQSLLTAASARARSTSSSGSLESSCQALSTPICSQPASVARPTTTEDEEPRADTWRGRGDQAKESGRTAQYPGTGHSGRVVLRRAQWRGRFATPVAQSPGGRSPMERRQFIVTLVTNFAASRLAVVAGVGGSVVDCASSVARPRSAGTGRLDRIGLQLYTVRDAL